MSMYLLYDQLKGVSVISLQTGHPVATTDDLIIKPDNLEAIAFWCVKADGRRLTLLMQDIRQIARGAIIIDNEEDMVEATEVVRLQQVLNQKFKLNGIAAVTESGQRLGRVTDFTLNLETRLVQKIHVKRPLLAAIFLSDLIIDREQIVDVTRKQIVVRDGLVKASFGASAVIE